MLKKLIQLLLIVVFILGAIYLIAPENGLALIKWVLQALLIVTVIVLIISPVFIFPFLRAKRIDKETRMKSRPGEYGWFAVSLSILPAIGACLGIFIIQLIFGEVLADDFTIPAWIYGGIALVVAIVGAVWAFSKVEVNFSARLGQEKVVIVLMILSSIISVITTAGIVLSILGQSIEFFSQVSIVHFLTGTEWSPDHSSEEHVGLITEGFGALPLFAGTFLITAIAMLVAVPVGLRAAVFMSEYASHKLRSISKPILEILAGIPTVVYGFFAAITISPLVVQAAEFVGLSAAPTNALAAGLVMGIMIIPFMSSLSDDVINAVPDSLRQGGLALGLTKAETIKDIVIPSAMPGIISAFLLAMSRALGETMIVVMAVGLTANLTANPLDSVTTVTVRIVDALTGDQEFGTPETLAAFALGMVLFVVTLALNLVSTTMVRRFKAKYE